MRQNPNASGWTKPFSTMCRRSPDVRVLHPHPPARCVPPQGERMILGDKLNLISPVGAGTSAGGIAGGGESPSVSAAPGISFDLVASPSRFHARDVTRNSVSLQLDPAARQRIHK